MKKLFEISDKLIDNIRDDIFPILRLLENRVCWDANAKSSLRGLIELLKSNGYITFVGHVNRYHLTRVGESCLYDVPKFRKGVLKIFRGKRIRIVCVSSGRYDRRLMAGVVGDTPVHKIKSREHLKYVFPDIGDHEIEYIGRRFMVVRSHGKAPIDLYQGAADQIDLNACDFILLDGKECCPIATFKLHSDTEISARLVGSATDERFANLQDAIKGMASKHKRIGLSHQR